MSQPPPFLLPPERPRARVGALLAGAGRQRVAVALLVLAAMLVAGVVWVRATPRPLGPANGQGAAAGDQGGSGDQLGAAPADQTLPRAAPGGSAPSGALEELAVHVAGRVRHPGLVRLPAGSRVQDAIHAAGGATDGADLDAINLARKLTDGEQVLVPGPGDPVPQPVPGATTMPGVPAAPLDLNTATVEQLDTLPGVGEVTAGRIVAYRTAHPFTAVDELLEVPGIGQRRYDQLKDLVTVG
jgi:competence protein ComEA